MHRKNANNLILKYDDIQMANRHMKNALDQWLLEKFK